LASDQEKAVFGEDQWAEPWPAGARLGLDRRSCPFRLLPHLAPAHSEGEARAKAEGAKGYSLFLKEEQPVGGSVLDILSIKYNE